MAQKHNSYEEKPMTRYGSIQGPSRRYRRLRNPTFPAAEWADKNPLLQRGEIGYEVDTHHVKVGDGITYWNDLPYIFDDAGQPLSTADYQMGNAQGGWTTMSQAQQDALNSGATTAKINQIATNTTNISNHIGDTNNPHSVTKAQVGLGNVDNTSDLNKPISTATQTALDGKQDTISDLSTIRSNAQAGKAASDTIATYGDIVTHDVAEFATAAQGALADSALQPGNNISELVNDVGYLTQHQTLADLGITATASEINVLDGITATTTELNYTDGVTSNIQTQLNAKAVDTDVVHKTGNETISGTKTFNETLQLKSNLSFRSYGSSDSGRLQFRAQPSDNVIRGTVAITDGYSTAGSGYNGFIAQMVARAGSTTSDPFNTIRVSNKGVEYIQEANDGTITGQYIIVDNYGLIPSARLAASGSVGQVLTKTTTGQDWETLAAVATSGSYNDLSNKPTIGNATLTIQKNSTTIDTFTANATSDKTINIAVPTKTSDITNDSDYQNSTQVATAINTHNTSATAHSNQFDAITNKIPAEASSSNKLADKAFVNSSIATNTANFIGTFNSVADLEAYSGTVTNNDYAFVIGTDGDGNTVYNRYKYTTATTPASWEFEYSLNNSSFTSAQWAAINSGATTTNIGQITTNTTNISNHVGNTSNPHSVTKAQVGLGNVDNTSDLNKPISTATQTALNLKANSADLATVATSGDYDDLTNKPTIPAAQVNSDWNAVSGVSQILNKPILATVATSGSYTDLSNKPTLGTMAAENASDYTKTSGLAAVATSGSYNDLSNKPTIPTTLAALTGDVSISSPTGGQVLQYDANLNKWKNSTSTVSIGFDGVTGSPYDNVALKSALDAKANSTDLATVATSGSYNDLSNKPTIPAAQVNSDWNAVSGVAQILNKPTLATVATSGSYNDLSNKPTIPTVGDGTITITQGGVTKGTFTTNQGGNTTVALDAGGGDIGNIDNLTITANASDEIQAVAVIDQNSGIAKTWTGTMAEYEAIVTKDPETEYIITDDIGGSATEIGQITEALNNKVDKGHQVVEFQEPTSANNWTWYRKYADGWVEQGGFKTQTATDVDTTVTLVVVMADTNYKILTTVRNNNTNAGFANVDNGNGVTTTGFSFRIVNKYFSACSPLGVYWQVSGMAA